MGPPTCEARSVLVAEYRGHLRWSLALVTHAQKARNRSRVPSPPATARCQRHKSRSAAFRFCPAFPIGDHDTSPTSTSMWYCQRVNRRSAHCFSGHFFLMAHFIFRSFQRFFGLTSNVNVRRVLQSFTWRLGYLSR